MDAAPLALMVPRFVVAPETFSTIAPPPRAAAPLDPSRSGAVTEPYRLAEMAWLHCAPCPPCPPPLPWPGAAAGPPQYPLPTTSIRPPDWTVRLPWIVRRSLKLSSAAFASWVRMPPLATVTLAVQVFMLLVANEITALPMTKSAGGISASPPTISRELFVSVASDVPELISRIAPDLTFRIPAFVHRIASKTYVPAGRSVKRMREGSLPLSTIKVPCVSPCFFR